MTSSTIPLKNNPIELAEVNVKSTAHSSDYGSKAEAKKITTGWRHAGTGGERGTPSRWAKHPGLYGVPGSIW
ncbi:hypothetical protein [Spirosoma pollinicola]|uniref:hypothetical protein n=1 Tax=Spirosoma pollinicola TaxID=2057025 RepID=UPI0012FD99C3|nr:hypothetical protein [Spirosoma pollinicola]